MESRPSFHPRIMPLRRSCLAMGIWSAISFCLLASGCGESNGQLPVVPVKGVLIFQGKPLDNALVTFHSADQTPGKITSGRATTKRDGSFELSTYNANDGIPEGDYAVTIECFRLRGGNGSWEPGPNILPPKYSNPQTSEIKLSVRKEDVSEKRIEIR